MQIEGLPVAFFRFAPQSGVDNDRMNPRFLRTCALSCTGLVAALLLGGCASGPSPEVCRMADWHMIGYEDGLRGLPADQIGAHRVACAKFQVTPDLAAYTAGRERGLKEYCQPRNGFRAGLNGQSYANVCPAATDAVFVDAFRQGRQIHDARSELRSTQAHLQSARGGLVQTDNALRSATAELVLPNVPTERRVFLASELVRLAEERRALEIRISALTPRVQELALQVQAMERQSPYAL